MFLKSIVGVILLATVHCHNWDQYHDFHVDMDGKEKGCKPPLEEALIVTPFKRSYADDEEITLSCQPGYELQRGRENATCQGFARFDGTGIFRPKIGPRICSKTPKCVLPIQDGIIVEPFKMFYEVGENITISCMDGYTLNERQVLTCKRGQNKYHINSYFPEFFNDASFKIKGGNACTKIQDCRPPIYDGLTVEPFKLFYGRGEEITLSCDEEYDLVGKKTSMCDDSGLFDVDGGIPQDGFNNYGVFEFSTSPCKKKAKCAAPSIPHLSVTPLKESYMSGDVVTISCDEGYELVGPNKTKCGYLTSSIFDMMNPNPMGLFQPPLMSRTCSRKPRCYAPKGKGVVISPEKTFYMVDEMITVSCADGYEFVNDDEVATRTCAKKSSRIRYYGSVKAEFVPVMEKPMCKKTPSCKSPYQRGVVLTPKKTSYDIGDLVKVSCEEGYTLKKSNESRCEEGKRNRNYRNNVNKPGQFSPEIDAEVCEKIPSCSPPRVEGLVVIPAKSFYKFGEKVSLSCEDGYEMRVAPMATCRRLGSYFDKRKDGAFDPEIGRDACRKPTVCAPPKREGVLVSPMKESYSEGETIKISCSEGFEQSSREAMVCERAAYCDGKRGVTGCFYPGVSKRTCIEKPKCDSPPMRPGLMVSPMKETYYDGDEVTFSCAQGYKLIGESKSLCVTKRSFFTPQAKLAVFSPSIVGIRCKKIMDPENEMSEPEESTDIDIQDEEDMPPPKKGSHIYGPVR